MFIDVHTHALHPKIAAKVAAQLNDHYGIQPVGSGLLDDLLAAKDRAGLDAVVVHGAATVPAQVTAVNDWAITMDQRPECFAFGSLHPGFPGWPAELERLAEHGIKGIKLHPEFQGFSLDSSALHPIFEAAGEDFVFMIHIGDRLPPEQNPSCPFKLAAILKKFPKLRVIAAHLGGWLHWRFALETLIGRDVYIDTSSSLAFIDDETLRTIFRRHDPQRILFGSDWPLFDPADELDLLRSRLALTDADLYRLTTNAAVPLGL